VTEEKDAMELTMTDAEASELADLLDGALGDLSSEIADTDNPGYRVALKERRERLRSVRDQLAVVGQQVG
jgi:hypothetical protein